MQRKKRLIPSNFDETFDNYTALMENSNPIIVNISSDEDADFSDTQEGGFGDGEYHNWLPELFDDGNGNTDHDSDDVVILSEVFSNTPKKSRLKLLKPSVEVAGNQSGSEDDDEGDCVVLDGDPEKTVFVGNVKADDDNDGVEIVGEKGEVACRDFPHARHLCVKFPFASTAHEDHCSQCHCYVCDLIAPCIHWGTGISSIDHCHASDENKYWKSERLRRKEGDEPVPIIRKIPFLPGPPKIHQVPPIAQPNHNPLLPNQLVRPAITRAHSMPSNISMLNAINQSRRRPQEPNIIPTPRYKPQSHLVSPQLQIPCNNNNTSRHSSHNADTRNSRLHPSRVPLKRTGFSGASPIRYDKSYSRSKSPKYPNYPSLSRCHAIRTPVRTVSSNQPNISTHVDNSKSKFSAPSSYVPSRAPVSSCLIRSPVTIPQMPFQPNLGSNFVNLMPFQPQPSNGSFRNVILCQPELAVHPNGSSPSQNQFGDAGDVVGYQLHPVPIVSSHPDLGNIFENQSSQFDAYNYPSSLINNGQNDFQQGSHGQSQSILDMSAVSGDNSQNQSAIIKDGDHHDPSVASEYDFHQIFVAPADNSSVLDSTYLPETTTNTSDYGWMFENHPSPDPFEFPLSPIFQP